MKRILSLVLAMVLVFGMIPFGAAAEATAATAETTNTPSGTVLRGDQYIRDPFILCDNGVYYMYGSIAYGQFEVFSSTDLLNWTTYSQPAFKAAEDSWVHEASKQTVSGVEPGYWAPEVFKLTIDGETAYYMIATFTQNKEPYNQQVSAIMKADNPLGPFEPWSVDENGDIAPITPNDGCSYMDATLYYEDGVPYLIYVHEWQCSCRDYDGNGSIAYVQLSSDLKTVVGTNTEWFKAWWMAGFHSELFDTQSPGVTDGPEVYTDANGQKYLLWSTHFLDKDSGEQVYVELATKFSKLSDTFSITNLKSNTLLLYGNNGGHGMIFTDFDGNEKMVLHTPSNSNARASIFDVVLTDDGIALQTYAVSGTVSGGLNGTVTAIRADGDKHIFKYALVDGSYQIDLPNGTYNLYFDCGSTEGMVKGVTVSGAAVTVPTLTKTYQTLTPYKEGNSGTASWFLTDNGCYEVATSNTDVNAVSMGYFADGVDMAATDFVIQTNVEASGTNAVMIGLAISGKNTAGSAETAVFGLNNKNHTAQIRVMNENLWPGYQSVASYDRTNFHLTILKQGTTITYYIDGVQAVQWTTSDYDFSGWTETKVGLGFYRMYDVTFSNYSYSTDMNISYVSGTVAGGLNGSITATNADGETQVFKDALVNGSYEILLNTGTYDLYFDCGDTEGLIPNVTITNVTETVPCLETTYQKMTVYKEGSAGTANWVLTDNGRYEVQTSNESVNSISMGWFVSGVNMSSTDFVIETNVEAAGTNSVMIGLAITGKNAAGSAETTVFGLNNSDYSAQIRALLANGWPGYKSVASYDRTNFRLKIVKSGTTITYYINGVQACQWTTADYDFAGWTDTKVGLGFYRMFDVTFSDYSYTLLNGISGTVAGNPSGDITVTDADGNETLYEGALVDGRYSISLTEGTYSLYFDCGDTEGMLKDVVVSGNVTANLEKTYQKLTAYKEGSDGTADWVLTDNGRYEVQTSNTGGNAISMGWFASGVNMADTDFTIQTNVEANGTNTVMIGLAMTGKNASGSKETAVFGLQNSGTYLAQIRALLANGWPGYKSVASYDRTNFRLTVVKEDSTITYYIDGVQACQWTTSDYDFGSWTDVKVGLGFYRMYDVTFFDYSYIASNNTDAYRISGTVGGNVSGSITATNANGESQLFANALVNGIYSIEVGSGVYSLYFDCGTTEGLIPNVTVTNASVTANLDKTYQKLTPNKAGVNGTADWVLTDNGRYEVQTSNTGGDAISMGLFAQNVDLASTDFVIRTTVEANGTSAAMIGLVLNQMNSEGLTETVVYGLNNSNYTAQIRVLLANGWPGYRNVASYDRTNYQLTILKQGTTITYFINDKQVCQWTNSDYDISGWTSAKVGIGFYRMFDVTFSDYSYSTDASDVAAAQGCAVTYNTLPVGVTVACSGSSFSSGTVFAKGSTVTVGNLNNEGTVYTITVNGEAMTVTEGEATFTLTENTQIQVIADNAYTVSGTVGEGLSGNITITNTDGEQTVITGGLKNSSYSFLLYEGEYSLYFDCGKTEGLIPSVTVDGADVTANLSKTYQKLTSYKEGSAGTANWVLTDNGTYQVQTSNTGGDSISMAWFESGVDMANTDFEINTTVEAAGSTSVMIGLAITGKNASGSAETAVFGLGNNQNFAQIRALKANGWLGYKSVASYDRTNFRLKIVKEGTTITYYINDIQACQWTTADYDFAGWTETKVGLGFYRMYDVTFSDYSYYAPNLVRGTVFGNVSGDVTATNASGESKVFEDALVNGSYTIRLDNGTYDLYFDCGDTEGMICGVVVKDAPVTANLGKTYQKLTSYRDGSDGTANWMLTSNGRYEVQTSDTGGNSISMGYFADGVDMSKTDFVMQTTAEAAGTTSVMIGLAITGKNASGNAETAVFGLNNSNNTAQIRTLKENGWPGYKNVAAYDRTNFRLTVVKRGTVITYYINDVQMCQWTTADYDFGGWTDTKVGLGIYRMQDVTFSDYSYFEGSLGLSFQKGELYESEKELSQTPKTWEATVFFPANTDSSAVGGVILGNYYTAGYMNFEVYTGGKTRIVLDGTSYVFDTMVYTGRPEHIAVVMGETAGVLRCYQNGILIGEKAYDSTKTYAAANMVLGGDQRTGNTLCFTGSLLSAAMFTDARTAEEIRADMTAMPTDENLLAWYDMAGLASKADVADQSGNGYDMLWSEDFFVYEDEKVLGQDYAYSFAVIGDTQIVARDEIDGKFTGYFEKIYDYVLDNKESKNIQFVVNLGDMTDTYGTGEHSTLEWQMNVEQLHRMDGVVPYSFVRGNHDDTAEYNSYLPYSDYADVIGGSYAQNMLNYWQELTVGNVKYLILALDYGPSDDVLNWAGSVIEDHPYHNVIVTTHAYLDGDGSLITDQSGTPPTASGGYNNGDDIWEKLIRKHENIVMVLCGHVDPNKIVTTYATGDNGNRIAQLLIDPQGIDAAQAPTGMIAMFYFSEDGRNVSVEWYSPIQGKHYKACNQFTMELDLVESPDSASVEQWNLVLDDDLKVNYYLNIGESVASTAQVSITVGEDSVSYSASELTAVDGLYVASVNVAAAQMNDTITVSVVNGGKTLFVKTYTVRSYCDTILADADYSAYHALIKEMLAYGGAAQTYFAYNTNALASEDITGTGAYDIPETAETEMVISGGADGIAFYGASLIFRDKIAVRFYFTGSSEGIEGAVVKDDMFYIEVADILPQNLDEAVTVTVNGLTVSYSPMNYIVRMNVKGSENLQALLKTLYNYHLAAKALRTDA